MYKQAVLLLCRGDLKGDVTSSESIVSMLTAKRAHFRTTLNHGAYAAVGLHARPS